MNDMTFSLTEVLAFMGLTQCVMILVYMVFRLRGWAQGLPALGYFFFLGIYFCAIIAARLDEWHDTVQMIALFARSMGPPLCYLLVRQTMMPAEKFGLRHLGIALLIPLIFGMTWTFADSRFLDIFAITGAIAGAFCLLLVWASYRQLADTVLNGKNGRERYWLMLTFIGANVLDVATRIVTVNLPDDTVNMIQAVLGLAFVYIVTTTLFRVYPPPLDMQAVPRGITPQSLTPAEEEVATRVRRLIEEDKLYHEPGFGRAELAREAGVSESAVSRIVNVTFGKTVPQLLNHLRVEDAKIMLKDPAIPVGVAAKEAGFASIGSFNRAFKDLTGENPTEWREKNKT